MKSLFVQKSGVFLGKNCLNCCNFFETVVRHFLAVSSFSSWDVKYLSFEIPFFDVKISISFRFTGICLQWMGYGWYAAVRPVYCFISITNLFSSTAMNEVGFDSSLIVYYFPPIIKIRKENHALKTIKSDVFIHNSSKSASWSGGVMEDPLCIKTSYSEPNRAQGRKRSTLAEISLVFFGVVILDSDWLTIKGFRVYVLDSDWPPTTFRFLGKNRVRWTMY